MRVYDRVVLLDLSLAWQGEKQHTNTPHRCSLSVLPEEEMQTRYQ